MSSGFISDFMLQVCIKGDKQPRWSGLSHLAAVSNLVKLLKLFEYPVTEDKLLIWKNPTGRNFKVFIWTTGTKTKAERNKKTPQTKHSEAGSCKRMADVMPLHHILWRLKWLCRLKEQTHISSDSTVFKICQCLNLFHFFYDQKFPVSFL